MMSDIQPTYYVKHPDGSHSVADPQPVHPKHLKALHKIGNVLKEIGIGIAEGAGEIVAGGAGRDE